MYVHIVGFGSEEVWHADEVRRARKAGRSALNRRDGSTKGLPARPAAVLNPLRERRIEAPAQVGLFYVLSREHGAARLGGSRSVQVPIGTPRRPPLVRIKAACPVRDGRGQYEFLGRLPGQARA